MLRLLALVALAALLAGCGGASSSDGPTVLAASSLTDVFPRIEPHARYSFGGSNALAQQIRHGAPADVYAAANARLPEELYADGLVRKPVVFARNALVLVVPMGNPAGIRAPRDLLRPGVKLVVAAAGVPVGDYTAEVLGRLGLSAVLEHAVSRESDVREVLSKVALGEADAGFVYATDAKAAPGKVTAIRLPARAQPSVAYEVAVVAGGDEAAGEAFVERLQSADGRAALAKAGFLP